MRIPARLKRYADKQSLVTFIILFITLAVVENYYPNLFPLSKSYICVSGSRLIYGHVVLACIGLYDLKNSGNEFWTFDKTILVTMAGYVILDTATFIMLRLLVLLNIYGIDIIPIGGMSLNKIDMSLYNSWDHIPFNLLSGLFCGVTIVLVNRIILACSRFIARRKA